MKTRTRKSVGLVVEELEQRCVPAYLAYSAQDFTVLTLNDNSVVHGFQLGARIATFSDAYVAPNGQWQVVRSSPTTFQQIASPTQAEWDVLFERYPSGWQSSGQTLSDNSLIIADAEALGPSSMSVAGQEYDPRVGQSLFIRYNPNEADPPPSTIHWLQFVTSNFPNPLQEPGVPYYDTPSGRTPFYDDGGAADGHGFVDVPNQSVRNELITWHADLFIVQDVQNGNDTTWVVWQGVSWGWQTFASASVSTTLTSSFNPSSFTDPVTFTATVSGESGGPTPTGTATFTIDGVQQSPVILAGGQASFSPVNPLSVGSHSVSVVYSGDSNYAPNSDSITQTVNPANTITLVASSLN